MTYQNTDRRAAVRHIQDMLRSLQIYQDGKVTVPIDGIYSSATADAVREFQKENGLPITGDVDKRTYDLLYEKSLEVEIATEDPLPIYLFQVGQTVQKGEESDFVMILQAILNVLTVAYDDFSPLPLNGVFNNSMEQTVRRFQMRNGIPASGSVNKATWNAIVRNYNKHIQQEKKKKKTKKQKKNDETARKTNI